MTDDEQRLIRLPQVLALVGLARATVYRGISQGTFPAPVALTGRARAWRLAQVRRWIDERPSAR